MWKLPRHEDDEAAEEGIGRILALSDGVFAVAITLLILEIAVPATTSDVGLPKALLGLWPRYLAKGYTAWRSYSQMLRWGRMSWHNMLGLERLSSG